VIILLRKPKTLKFGGVLWLRIDIKGVFMGKQLNYKQLFARNAEISALLDQVCPTMNEGSGIYVLTREEDGKKFTYIGQAINIKRRMIAHIQGYSQHIDISIKKRGFYSVENPYGWKLTYKNFPVNELDEKERYYIKMAQEQGYELLNIINGGQGEGKFDINDRKPTKTYKDGLKQGYLNAQRDVAKLFEKNLEVSIKGNSNKNKEKALQKFNDFMKID